MPVSNLLKATCSALISVALSGGTSWAESDDEIIAKQCGDDSLAKFSKLYMPAGKELLGLISSNAPKGSEIDPARITNNMMIEGMIKSSKEKLCEDTIDAVLTEGVGRITDWFSPDAGQSWRKTQHKHASFLESNLFFWDKLDQDSRTYFKSPNYCESRFRKRDISYQYPVQVQEKEGADYVSRSRQCNIHYNVKAAGLVRLDQNGGWTFVKKMDGTYKNADIIDFISSTLIDVTYAIRKRYSNDLPDYAEAWCTITPQQQTTANLSELQFDLRDGEKAFYRVVVMINNPLETQQGEINNGQPLARSSLAVAVDDVSSSVLATIERHARCMASNKKILMQQQRTPKLE